MSKVFQVKPKRLKRSNGTVLTPDMVVTVTTMQHTATPFYNGAKFRSSTARIAAKNPEFVVEYNISAQLSEFDAARHVILNGLLLHVL